MDFVSFKVDLMDVFASKHRIWKTGECFSIKSVSVFLLKGA